MKNDYTPKKINALFNFEIIVAILGIIATISYFIYKHVKIIILDFEDLTAVPVAILLSVILIVISSYAKKLWMFLTGVLLAVFTFSTITNSIKIKFVYNSIFLIYITIFLLVLFIYVILFALIFKRKKLLELENERKKKLLELENERKKKLLALETEKCLSACNTDNNLWNLMSHCSTVTKNVKLCQNLLTCDDEKNSFNAYIIHLSKQKQNYIKNAILRHYKIICETAETKNLYLSKKVYDACLSLKNSINKYIAQFDEQNKKLSLIILEKTNLIINFTEKYLNVYNTSSRYNIDEMKGQDFEKYCANLLMVYGFVNVQVTRGSGDQGVDIIGTYNNLKYAIQCKRYSHKLSNTPIQEVAAGKNYYNCQRALVITNNFFTEGAVELAKANNVELWDRDQLMQLIYYTDGQWNDLLENIKIEFSESDIKENGFFDKNTVAVESENPVIEEFNSNHQQKVTNGNWRCSKCGLEVIADYNYCPFCKYVEKSDYKNEANK